MSIQAHTPYPFVTRCGSAVLYASFLWIVYIVCFVYTQNPEGRLCICKPAAVDLGGEARRVPVTMTRPRRVGCCPE